MQMKKAGAVAVGAIATVAAIGTSAAASPTTGPGGVGPNASVLAAAKANPLTTVSDKLGLNTSVLAGGKANPLTTVSDKLGPNASVLAAAKTNSLTTVSDKLGLNTSVLAAAMANPLPTGPGKAGPNASVLTANSLPAAATKADLTASVPTAAKANSLPAVPGKAVPNASVLTAAKANLTAVGNAVSKDALGLGASQPVQPLLSLFGGSALSAVPLQLCGSTATAGVGAAAAVASPNTVLGDCDNANVRLKQDNVPALISLFDDTSVDLVPWQVCGSTVVGGVGATAALNTPNTVTGDCDNASTTITAPDWPDGPRSLVSLFSGSALNVLPWQVCGSTAVMGVGVATGVNSPTTVVGSCRNAITDIDSREPSAILPLLSNVGLNVVPLQVCASDSLLGIVGVSPAINSPANVLGGCDNGGLFTNGH